MQRPRREEFILDVRRSARTLQKPIVEADSDAVDTDAIAKILHRAALWLTPKVVEHYHPDDFTGWPKEEQDRLRAAVEEFRRIAAQVPADKPATIDQFTEGAHRFRDLINVLGKMVRDEWMHAIETVERQAQEWSAETEWRSRRVNKKLTESLIGTYEAPQLLIFAEPNLYVLDPLARFIPGGQGSFDLTIQPSYYTTSLYRDDSGNWYVHLEVRNGVSNGKRVEWGRDAFRQCIEQLRVFV
jgi:hypothetical protein